MHLLHTNILCKKYIKKLNKVSVCHMHKKNQTQVEFSWNEQTLVLRGAELLKPINIYNYKATTINFNKIHHK